MTSIYAFCHADGVISFGPKVPEGALPLARGEAERVHSVITVTARHAWDGHLLVPGVPEAENQSKALEALEAHIDRLQERYPELDWSPEYQEAS